MQPEGSASGLSAMGGSGLEKIGTMLGGSTSPMTASPFAQGAAGATNSQAGNPNLGGFSSGLSEVTNPGMGFLSGLMSGANI